MEAHNDRFGQRETRIQVGKSENHIRDQIQSPLDKYFWRKPKTKCQWTENPQTAMNTQSEKPKFFGTKTDLKKIWKIPMPPSRMKKSVQSTNPTKDNTTTIITETSTKTFFIIITFESETCWKTTLITRCFLREGVDAWHLVSCTAAASRNFILNYKFAFYG